MTAADPYRTLYARAPTPMVTVRDDGRVVDANPAFCAATRIARESIVGAGFADLLSAQDRGATRVYLRRALDQGTAEWTLALSGAPDVRWSVRAVTFLGQVAVLLLWTPPEHDVARTLVPALAALVRRIPGQAVLLLSPDLWVLGAWGLDELGVDDDGETVGRHLSSLVDADETPLGDVSAAVADEEPWDGPLRWADGRGGVADCSSHFLPARVVGGTRQGAGFLVVRRAAGRGAPPTDRRRLHRLARIGEFSVEVAEGLRDRVRALLRADPGGAEAERERVALETFEQRLRRFADAARVEGRVPAADAAEGVDRRWRDFLRDQGIDLAVESDDLLGVDLDLSEEVVATVLDELLENARVAVTDVDDPRIEVRFAVGEGAVVVTVGDTGPGVPASRREAVFHPFVSGWPGRLGLGLATARAQLELAGGTLEFGEASAGLSVVASLPTADSPQPATAAGEGLRSPLLVGRTVLLVDESEDARTALARILSNAGMSVREAWSFRSGIAELVQRGGVDAVVCTVGSDEGAGARLVADLGEVAPELVPRTIVLVDLQTPTRKPALEQRWGCTVLARPLVVQHLLETLERLS